MTLRTPRRRISPQTKLRYRAIKGFLRRALGSSSQPDLQITSSIAINVTDRKHKISALEQQLNEVDKQCHDSTYHENSSREEYQSFAPELRNETSQEDITSEKQLKGLETKPVHKTSEHKHKKCAENNYIKANNETSKVNSVNKMADHWNGQIAKQKKENIKFNNRADDLDADLDFRKHKTKSAYDNFVSAHSTSSFYSLDQCREMLHANTPGYTGEEKRNRTKPRTNHHKEKMYRDLRKPILESYDYQNEEREGPYTNNRKQKRNSKQLDQDFIADIIRRQYKPVKMFGRRGSDLSQFSAPVCHDREFCLIDDKYIEEDSKVRPCYCGGHHFIKHVHHSDHSDIKSVCDIRLYSDTRNSYMKNRKKHADAYNSDFYDLVPVKEKTSPKSRRKFFEDNMMQQKQASAYCKEVPPSPRSHRPRLNLKAQYYTASESDYNIAILRNSGKRNSPKSATRHQETEEFEQNLPVKYNKRDAQKYGLRHQKHEDFEDNYYTSKIQQMEKHKHLQNMKCRGEVDLNRGMGTISKLQYTSFDTEENTAAVESPLNKTLETTSSVDKTDKALCEIKDILQNFLQEIKKEASSHDSKSEVSAKLPENNSKTPNDVTTTPVNGHSCSNYNPAQYPVTPLPYMPTLSPFGNTCCYPMMPVCPINCMPNSYAVPSANLHCNNCVTQSSEINHNKNTSKLDVANDTLNCETDELIKEIHKFVLQSPKFCRTAKGENHVEKAYPSDAKVLTSRSAGGSTRVRRHDASVGTPKINGVSKSCEAIGSKILPDVYTSETNASYSDTVLEKHSRDATVTRSISETESSTELSEVDKAKRNKFTKLMKTLGLIRKNKRDVIEEMSESESTIDVDVKKKPPFRQDFTNYAMYGQEYHRLPPVSPHYRPEYPPDYRPYNALKGYHDSRMPQYEHGSPLPHYHSGYNPTAPPYTHSYEGYNQMQPQIPLCLKEVEVKSIGCQSERKMSFLRKLTHKVQQPAELAYRDVAKNCSTQTAQNKPGLFNWKMPQPKVEDISNNPLSFGYKTQKKLAQGDMNIRNAMLKKMFKKKNPFSPGNLIMRTLMGKDRSSFGEAPAMYRTRMFV